MSESDTYLVHPDPADSRLTRRMGGIDHDGRPVEQDVAVEMALTLFLNGQEIVTMMTIGDYPDPDNVITHCGSIQGPTSVLGGQDPQAATVVSAPFTARVESI